MYTSRGIDRDYLQNSLSFGESLIELVKRTQMLHTLFCADVGENHKPFVLTI